MWANPTAPGIGLVDILVRARGPGPGMRAAARPVERDDNMASGDPATMLR